MAIKTYRMNTKLLSITLLLMLSMLGIAQPTGGNLGQLELSVTDKYKAKVAEATKVSEFPNFKDTTTQKLTVNYRINSVPLSVSYKPKPLPPAQIAQVPVDKIKQGLVRVGVGFYGTPLAEVYWNANRSSKRAYGFFGRHLSTQRGVQDVVFSNNSFSHNELGGYYTHFYSKLKWESELSAYANKQSYYGIPNPNELENVPYFDEKAPAIWRRGIQYSTALEHISSKKGNFERSSLKYNFYNDSYKSFENNIANLNQFVLPTSGIPLQVDLGLEYTQSVYDSLRANQYIRSSFIVQARPHIETTLKNIRFDFGLNVYTNSIKENPLNDTSYTTFSFFPELSLSYPLVKDVLSVYGGLKGRLVNNTLRSLSADNPFLGPEQNLQASFERDVFVGLKGILSATTSFNAKGGYMNVSNQVLYYRNPIFSAQDSLLPALNVLYDDANIWYIRGELGLNYGNNLQLDLYGELRAYSMATQKLAWHIPAFTAGLQSTYTLKEKIQLNANLAYIGPREAFAQELNPGRESTLKGYVDAGLGVQYLYNSRLSAFVNAYNLLSTPNTLYLGYDAQRINIMFGIAYQF
jgi:hypothetical protein